MYRANMDYTAAHTLRKPILPVDIKAYDVMRSTSACPTVFPPHPMRVETTSSDSKINQMDVVACDGGLVSLSPFMLATTEVLAMEWSHDGGVSWRPVRKKKKYIKFYDSFDFKYH